MLPPRTPHSVSRPRDMRLTMTGRISLAADARYSLAAGASMSYRNSAFPGASGRQLVNIPKVIKTADERNLKDREVQNLMIERIVGFLSDCVNPAPKFSFDAKNFLRVANRNDFKNVFEFLFQYIQPNFQIPANPPNKMNEEVVKLMNGLGYPYFLKNSSMQTMTTPTTWPMMLSVLEWLVNFVELENAVHEDRNVGDKAKWDLYVSCYKQMLETKAVGGASSQTTLKLDKDTYNRQFDAYRSAKLGEDDENDNFEAIRNKRIACDAELSNINTLIGEEENKIGDIERNIAGLQGDIGELEKYSENLRLTIARNEEIMTQSIENCRLLQQRNEELEAKRMEKENEIAKQKISGDEARSLYAKRQMLREEISTVDERLNQIGRKHEELQPKFFKLSASVRSEYKSLISRLRDLSQAFGNSADVQQQIAQLEQFTFSETIADFKESRIDNKLSQLLVRLKGMFEEKLSGYQRSIEELNQKKADLSKEIQELETSLERRMANQKFENEKVKRGLEDELRPSRNAKHNLDIAAQKHQATSAELKKYTEQLNVLGEELAEKHKKYLQYKQSLDGIYNEVQTVMLESLTKLCDRYEKYHKQKIRFQELGQLISKEQSEMLKKLSNEEMADDSTV